jgi:hypothetical protein
MIDRSPVAMRGFCFLPLRLRRNHHRWLDPHHFGLLPRTVVQLFCLRHFGLVPSPGWLARERRVGAQSVQFKRLVANWAWRWIVGVVACRNRIRTVRSKVYLTVSGRRIATDESANNVRGQAIPSIPELKASALSLDALCLAWVLNSGKCDCPGRWANNQAKPIPEQCRTGSRKFWRFTMPEARHRMERRP